MSTSKFTPALGRCRRRGPRRRGATARASVQLRGAATRRCRGSPGPSLYCVASAASVPSALRAAIAAVERVADVGLALAVVDAVVVVARERVARPRTRPGCSNMKFRTGGVGLPDRVDAADARSAGTPRRPSRSAWMSIGSLAGRRRSRRWPRRRAPRRGRRPGSRSSCRRGRSPGLIAGGLPDRDHHDLAGRHVRHGVRDLEPRRRRRTAPTRRCRSARPGGPGSGRRSRCSGSRSSRPSRSATAARRRRRSRWPRSGR